MCVQISSCLTRQQSAWEGGLFSAFAAFTNVLTGQGHGCFPTESGLRSVQVGKQHLQGKKGTSSNVTSCSCVVLSTGDSSPNIPLRRTSD
jgi:hypothetical protein